MRRRRQATTALAVAVAAVLGATIALTACTGPASRDSAEPSARTTPAVGGPGAPHLTGSAQQQALELANSLRPSMAQPTLRLSTPALSQSWSHPACSELAHASRFWTVEGTSVAHLAAELAATPLPGYREESGASLLVGRTYSEVDETRIPAEAFDPSPRLQLTMAKLPGGGVGLRADAYVPGPESVCAHTRPAEGPTSRPTP